MLQDPYNFPFPNRKDLMSLSTIPEQKSLSQRPSLNLSHNDIDGAIPKPTIGRFLNKQSFVLSTQVNPNPDNWRKINKVSDPLSIGDIQGARPKGNEFRTQRAPSNPLQPVYKLASVPQISYDPGRAFLRDTLNIGDIETRNKSRLKKQPIPQQQIMGTTTKQPLKPLQDGRRDKYNVRDINQEGIYIGKRTTNPLDPTYQWQEQEFETANPDYGRDSIFKPSQRHPACVNKVNDRCLNINDIRGTKANSFYDRSLFLNSRREFKEVMRNHDIEKSQASSLKKGISTQRQTNPLRPNYRVPGHSQIRGGLVSKAQAFDKFIIK